MKKKGEKKTGRDEKRQFIIKIMISKRGCDDGFSVASGGKEGVKSWKYGNRRFTVKSTHSLTNKNKRTRNEGGKQKQHTSLSSFERL